MSDVELTETYDATNGRIAWRRLGDAGGRSVVLVHGTPWSSYTWRNIALSLARHYEVFLWDMPGYGRSEKYDGQDVSIGAQGRVLAELLDHWGLRDPCVVAHDIGGAVALRTHLLHGASYSKLALADPVALAPWGSEFYRLAGEHAEVFSKIPPRLHEAMVRAYIATASDTELHPATMDRLAEPWLTDDGQPAFYRQIAQADQRYTDEVQDRYPTIDIPVLVCWGVEDTWLPPAKGQELVAMIPNAQLRLIDGAGHLLQEDAPAQLTEALLTFLQNM